MRREIKYVRGVVKRILGAVAMVDIEIH